MRQLDLFGSLFNTPSQEDKPEENAVVVKKEDENKVSPQTSIANAYSKNRLRSERAPGKTSTKDPSSTAVKNLVATEDNLIISSTEGPSIITLFNAADDKDNSGDFSAITEENIIEQEQTFVPAEADKIQDIQQKPVGKVDERSVIDQPEIIILEEAVVTPPLQKEPTEVTVASTQTVPPKQKKPKLPELERTGSIIFRRRKNLG